MNPNPRSMLIALGIPAVTITVGVLTLGGSTATIFGVPVLFMLIFAMFPVTSALMACSWYLFDRDADYEEEPATTISGAGK